MPTYRLTIAYDGTDFAGWQKQEPPDPASSPGRHSPIDPAKLEPGLEPGKPGRIALRTVQAVLERAVREVVREPVFVQGASRTDTGVHARAQAAVFTCSGDPGEESGGAPDSRGRGGWPLSRGPDRLLRAINSRLPGDVQVVAVEPVARGFNPIGDCLAKGYSYTFWSSLDRPLWERRYVWHTWAELDVGAMQRAAGLLIGEHDFASFAAAGHGRQNTVREIHECRISERGPMPVSPMGRASGGATSTVPPRLVRLDISGNGFLYNMVRIIAGTLHEVGRGRIAPDAIPEIIAGLDRRRAGPTLPPEGLCLEWIRYPDAQPTRSSERS